MLPMLSEAPYSGRVIVPLNAFLSNSPYAVAWVVGRAVPCSCNPKWAFRNEKHACPHQSSSSSSEPAACDSSGTKSAAEAQRCQEVQRVRGGRWGWLGGKRQCHLSRPWYGAVRIPQQLQARLGASVSPALCCRSQEAPPSWNPSNDGRRRRTIFDVSRCPYQIAL